MTALSLILWKKANSSRRRANAGRSVCDTLATVLAAVAGAGVRATSAARGVAGRGAARRGEALPARAPFVAPRGPDLTDRFMRRCRTSPPDALPERFKPRSRALETVGNRAES
jgi:hypothetical protein